jgi:hypothetical protein
LLLRMAEAVTEYAAGVAQIRGGFVDNKRQRAVVQSCGNRGPRKSAYCSRPASGAPGISAPRIAAPMGSHDAD